jgi:flagellar biosynthesis/type III secretory pathway protein FliH
MSDNGTNEFYNEHNIRIGNVGGSITGNIGIDSPISNSFNRIQNSAVDDELKNKLAELTAAVAELCKQLHEEQAQGAARDLQTFTEEATAEASRRSILEVIGNSLSKTAETVQQGGGPVISRVKAVLVLVA